MKQSNFGNVVALAGGVGGAKLAYGLYQIVPPENLTIIVNTGDDFEHLGLHISPDLDTVMYTLAGVANPATGWGVKDESWNMMAALARYGQPTWFQLGDRDLATHLLRTKWLREKYPYNWVTRELCQRLGVRCTVLPMSEAMVRTMLMTDQGELAFQEYFVQQQCRPVVRSIRFAGAEQAQPSREVASALRNADVIIFCPSNPLLSLDPILALPNMRRIIAASRVPKIAVSPIVGGAALKGPAAKLMAELGQDVSPLGVARHLQDVLTGFVLDHVDQAYQEAVSELGLRSLVTGTVMLNDEDRVRLAREVLAFAAG
ncbi:MAG: 2-phospho-L-lactate transferase [Anaerolineae bacterium]|nr:2-phospho-L-lactate transferase [Anaerolineales bacterium]MCQ3979609.1 2-phospho-L-lactate transferase [Anaerolineae bacterium]